MICKMHEYTLIIVPRLVTFTILVNTEDGTVRSRVRVGGGPGVWIPLPLQTNSGPSKFRYILLRWDPAKCLMKILCISWFCPFSYYMSNFYMYI